MEWVVANIQPGELKVRPHPVDRSDLAVPWARQALVTRSAYFLLARRSGRAAHATHRFFVDCSSLMCVSDDRRAEVLASPISHAVCARPPTGRRAPHRRAADAHRQLYNCPHVK